MRRMRPHPAIASVLVWIVLLDLLPGSCRHAFTLTVESNPVEADEPNDRPFDLRDHLPGRTIEVFLEEGILLEGELRGSRETPSGSRSRESGG